MDLKKVIEEKGELWVISALIDHSIGYYTYSSAKSFINSVLKGLGWYAERTVACYRGDYMKELKQAVEWFEHLEKTRPEKVKALIEFVSKTANLPWETQQTISQLYPTMI